MFDGVFKWLGSSPLIASLTGRVSQVLGYLSIGFRAWLAVGVSEYL